MPQAGEQRRTRPARKYRPSERRASAKVRWTRLKKTSVCRVYLCSISMNLKKFSGKNIADFFHTIQFFRVHRSLIKIRNTCHDLLGGTVLKPRWSQYHIDASCLKFFKPGTLDPEPRKKHDPCLDIRNHSLAWDEIGAIKMLRKNPYSLGFFTFLCNFLRHFLSLRTIAQTFLLSISLQLAWLYKGHSGYCFDIPISYPSFRIF